MNKKSLFLGMAALAIAAFVFVGCDDGATEVEGSVGAYMVGSGPSVTAADIAVTTPTTKNGTLYVNFKPVAGAVSYKYFLSTAKNGVIVKSNDANAEIGYSQASDGTFSPTKTGTESVDPTKAHFQIPSIGDKVAYYVGIQATNALNNSGNIVWSVVATAAN
jgi:hypothetical protein